MITRQEYMSGKATHREYYGDIVRDIGIVMPPSFGLVIEARKSKDEHYNDIPMSKWDSLAISSREAISKALKERGDSFSLAGGVCVMKEAVKQAVERKDN